MCSAAHQHITFIIHTYSSQDSSAAWHTNCSAKRRRTQSGLQTVLIQIWPGLRGMCRNKSIHRGQTSQSTGLKGSSQTSCSRPLWDTSKVRSWWGPSVDWTCSSTTQTNPNPVFVFSVNVYNQRKSFVGQITKKEIKLRQIRLLWFVVMTFFISLFSQRWIWHIYWFKRLKEKTSVWFPAGLRQLFSALCRCLCRWKSNSSLLAQFARV